MAWITNDGAGSTVNLTHSSGSSTIFRLKELLKQAGWTVPSSSDGTTYNASGDQITHDGSGANGMDNASAWFRIQDPGGLREYVFQRHATYSYNWAWLYSASDKFVKATPTPSATQRPEAEDEVGLSKLSEFPQTIFPTSGSWRAHIGAQNAAHNGVYAWWCCVYVTGEEAFLCCEALTDDSAPSAYDGDPCIHFGSDDTPVYSTLAGVNISADTDTFRGWMRYGEDNEEFQGISAVFFMASGYTMWPAPLSSDYVKEPSQTPMKTLSITWFRHTNTGEVKGEKGRGKYIHWNPCTAEVSYTDLVQDGSNYWLVWRDLLLPGWPDATLPGT